MFKQANLIFKHAQIRIEGNTIRCENHTIQMANISRFWTGKRHETELSLNMIIIIVLVNMIGVQFFNVFCAALTVVCSIAVFVWRYAAQGNDGLHLKLCSGDVYSFIPDNKFFLDQAYILLNELILGKKDSVDFSIIFEGNGEIVDHQAVLQAEARRQAEREEEKIREEKVKEEKAAEDKLQEEKTMDESTEKDKGKEGNAKEEKPKVSYGVNDQLISQLQALYTAYSEMENADTDILSLIGQTTDKVISNDFTGIKELYGKFIESGLINECNNLGLNVLIGEIKNRIFV